MEEVLGILAGSAITAAVVSGLIAEWRTRAAEKRAVKREEEAERRTELREQQRDQRDRMLRQIDETQGDYLGTMNWLMYRAIGTQEHMDRTVWGPEHWPQAQWYLIAEEDLLDLIFDVRLDLERHPQGSGLTMDEVAKIGALQGRVLARLEAQRERVRSGEAPFWPSAEWLRRMLDKAEVAFGVPPGYKPQVNG